MNHFKRYGLLSIILSMTFVTVTSAAYQNGFYFTTDSPSLQALQQNKKILCIVDERDPGGAQAVSQVQSYYPYQNGENAWVIFLTNHVNGQGEGTTCRLAIVEAAGGPEAIIDYNGIDNTATLTCTVSSLPGIIFLQSAPPIQVGLKKIEIIYHYDNTHQY